MKILKFPKIEKIISIGGMQGQVSYIIENVKYWFENHEKDKNVLFICMGGAKLGLKNEQEKLTEIGNCNKYLIKRNSYLLIMRGSMDNPEIFNFKPIVMANVQTISDFTILQLKTKNFLCVGGGITIDRSWRQMRQEYVNRFKDDKSKKTLFVEGEEIVMDENEIRTIVDANVEIDGLFTYTKVRPQKDTDTKYEYWAKEDEKLEEDTQKETVFLMNLVSALNAKHKMDVWVGNNHTRYISWMEDDGMCRIQTSFGSDPIDVLNEVKRLQEKSTQKKYSAWDFEKFLLKPVSVDYMAKLRDDLIEERRGGVLDGIRVDGRRDMLDVGEIMEGPLTIDAEIEGQIMEGPLTIDAGIEGHPLMGEAEMEEPANPYYIDFENDELQPF